MTGLLLPGFTAVLYLALAWAAAQQTFDQKTQDASHRLSRLLPLLALMVIALHGWLTFGYLNHPDGLNLSLTNTLSLTALVTVGIFWGTSLQNQLDGFSVILMPFAAFCAILPALPIGSAQPIALSGPLLSHILLSIIAYSLLAVASLQALFMAYIDQQIRTKQSSRFLSSMPPLQQLETLLFRFILVGLLVLTASLISGFIYLDDLFDQHVAHKTVLSLLAWLLFTILLLGHHFLGWRGRTAVRLCLVAFTLLVVGYIGSKFVLEIVLTSPL